MMKQKQIRVTRGRLIGRAFRPEGEVLDIDARQAERLIKAGIAEPADGDEPKPKPKPKPKAKKRENADADKPAGK